MDLSSIKAENRAFEIRNPKTDEPIGLIITLIPESDAKVQAVQRKFLNDRIQRRKPPTAEQIESSQLAKVIAGIEKWEWTGEANFHGEKPEFNEANARKLFKELPWIRKQVDEEIGDDAAFFQS